MKTRSLLTSVSTLAVTARATMAQGVPPGPISETAPATTWSVFGMDSTAGVMIGLVMMLVFILAIVAVSRSDRTTIA